MIEIQRAQWAAPIIVGLALMTAGATSENSQQSGTVKQTYLMNPIKGHGKPSRQLQIHLREIRNARTCINILGQFLTADTCGRVDFARGERIEYADKQMESTFLIVRIISRIECGSKGCSTSVFDASRLANSDPKIAAVSIGAIYRCRINGRPGIALSSDGGTWTCFSSNH